MSRRHVIDKDRLTISSVRSFLDKMAVCEEASMEFARDVVKKLYEGGWVPTPKRSKKKQYPVPGLEASCLYLDRDAGPIEGLTAGPAILADPLSSH